MSKIVDGLVDVIDNPITKGAAFALWAVPIYLLLDLEVGDTDYSNIRDFIEWFGVPYGLLLALVLVNVWTQFDATDRAFDQEADTVLKVYDTFLLTSTETLRTEACQLLLDYSRHVQEHYFSEPENKTLKSRGDSILNELRVITGRLHRTRIDKLLALELLRLINELIDDRGDRLSHSKQRIPLPVLLLSVIASFIWLIPFFILKFTHPMLGAIFVTGVTFVVVAILLIIMDLDDPVEGTWDVNMESWKDLIDTIQIP